MKATTLRPFLIVLLFGFLPTSGWVIVRGGADHTVLRVIDKSCPMPGAAAHRHAVGPWPASPAHTGTPRPGTVYAKPSAWTAPHASHGPAPQTGTNAPGLVATSYPDDGFGDFSVSGTLPGPADSALPNVGPAALAGPADNGIPGTPRNPSMGLLDPPGGTGTSRSGTLGSGTDGTGGTDTPGTSTGGQGPTGSNGNQQLTAPEPSTLALFLAGTAALGFALRRRHLRG